MNYQIKNADLTVEISSFGGELKSVRTKDKKDWLWQGSPDIWKDSAPNIFPYVARLTNGQYSYRGENYDMKIHGFVKYMELSVAEQKEDSITFCLESSPETLELYPFQFCFYIHYILTGNHLTTVYEILNKDEKDMFFGVGGHPGFQVPMSDGEKFEDCYLEFDGVSSPKRIGFTDDCYVDGTTCEYPLRDGRYIDLQHDLFDQDAIVLTDVSKAVSLKSKKDSRELKVTYEDFPYLGIWHKPHSQAQYICIEPWSSLPSRAGIVEDLEQQKDLVCLNAGKSLSVSFTAEFYS